MNEIIQSASSSPGWVYPPPEFAHHPIKAILFILGVALVLRFISTWLLGTDSIADRLEEIRDELKRIKKP